ncbi:transposase [Bacillus cereus]
MSRKNNVYSDELKLQVVQSYLNGEGGYLKIASQYGLKSKTQVENWVKWYKENGTVNSSSNGRDGRGGERYTLQSTHFILMYYSHP